MFREICLFCVFVGTVLSQDVLLSFEIGETYNDSFKMFGKTIHTTPQIAVWIEDSKGSFISTLMVTYKTAKGKYAGHRGGREGSLPVWAHSRGKLAKRGGYMPSGRDVLVDAISGASPKSNFDWQFSIDEKYLNSGYVIKLEVNNSMDFNMTYADKMSKDSKFYNNDVNGQPSLVYALSLDKENMDLILEGSGDPAGLDGVIDPIGSELTSALNIVKSIHLTRVSK